MKKFFSVGVVLLVVLGSVALVFADIKETQRERGGSDLQNVHDRVICVSYKIVDFVHNIIPNLLSTPAVRLQGNSTMK